MARLAINGECRGTRLKVMTHFKNKQYHNYSTWTYISTNGPRLDASVGRDSSVQRLATGWTVRGSYPCGGRDFPRLSTPNSRPNHPPVQCSPGLFRGVLKRPGRGANQPPSSNTEVKNDYSCKSTPPLVLRGLLYGLTLTTSFHIDYHSRLNRRYMMCQVPPKSPPNGFVSFLDVSAAPNNEDIAQRIVI